MWAARRECTSGLPVQVGYSGVMRAAGVAIRRARARVWFVRCDTTERQPRTCEWDRAVVAHYLAFNGRRSGARLAPAVLTPPRRRGTDRYKPPCALPPFCLWLSLQLESPNLLFPVYF